MTDFTTLPFFGANVPVNIRLAEAAQRLMPKLRAAWPQLKAIGISTYSQKYMNVVFGTPFRIVYNLAKYAHILSNALEGFELASLGQRTLVDYGGGHGVLSLLAKEAGVGTVVHSDIFPTSSRDAQILAEAIGARPGPFFLGDTPEFRRQMESSSLRADAIVNYDVLEHIYNLRRYFLDLAAVTSPGGRWYMASGANLYNEALRTQLRQTHQKLEGSLDGEGDTAYVKLRARMIAERGPDLLPEEVELLAHATRGWRIDDIHRAVDLFLSSGHLVSFCPPEDNTADPRNGNWGENMVPLETYTEHPVLRRLARSVAVEASADWTPFIEEDAAKRERFLALAKADPREALRHAPYYCVRVCF